MPLDLDHFKLGNSLPEIYLIEDYIDASEQDRIIREVRSSQAKWVQVGWLQWVCQSQVQRPCLGLCRLQNAW